MREGMVLYDAAGREIWACPNVDSRAAAEADELVRSGAARRIFETGGDWVVDHLAGPLPLDPRPRARDVRARSPTSGMLSDWVLYRLTGRFVTDPSSRLELRTCSTSRARTWSPELLELVGLDPAIVARGRRAGHGRRAR